MAEKNDSKKPRPPAKTLEDREKQLVALAVELAERQIRNGTASAQVLTHFLKLGTTNNRLEQERLRHENALLEAKTEQIRASARSDEMYEKAIKAMRSYSGQPEDESDEYD